MATSSEPPVVAMFSAAIQSLLERREEIESASYRQNARAHLEREREKLFSQNPNFPRKGNPSIHMTDLQWIPNHSDPNPSLDSSSSGSDTSSVCRLTPFRGIPRQSMTIGHSIPPIECVSEMIDNSVGNANFLRFCIPFIKNSKVVPTNDHENPPVLPKMMRSLQRNPDLKVTIRTRMEDFKDTWIISGRIDYGNVEMLQEKTIQVFVQISSLKVSGLYGTPNPEKPFDFINWGVSKIWPCGSKMHRFRITFHNNQKLPVNDRVTVVSIIRNNNTGTKQISNAATFDLHCP